ncbi:DHA2 family efflux MFS transporter permease subunit [Nocardioides litoris]|uniref:DHA2 family efflux MFS transporter permease subunit n=1 Tax=Nocardioides litoris TaxID=1926648 RepID=UPI00111F25D7|nr:DHA2 family efflux MFS transporter permease subunit [Nocardioides litoris]
MVGIDYKYKVATIAIVALFMDLLDLTVVNVALPTIQRDFGTDSGAISLVVTAYLTSLAVVMPASGWAAQRFGAPRTFQFAVAVFTFASLLGAVSWSFGALVAARALQGVGGGLLVPVGMALLFRAFPEDERAKASALFAAPAAIAPALGPLLGGLLVDAASWRWAFIINLPAGAAAFVLGVAWLRSEPSDPRHRLDLGGLVAVSAGVVSLTLGLTWLADDGASPYVVGAGFVAVLALFLLVRRPSDQASPIIDFTLFRRRSFALGQFTMFTSSAGFGGLLFALPLLLQGEDELNATQTGLIMALHAVGILIATPLGPRLVSRYGDQVVLAIGIVGSAVCTAGLACLAHGATQLSYAALLLLAGISFGLMIVPQQTMPFSELADEDLPQGTSLLSTVRQLGLAVGTSLVALPIAWQAGRGGYSVALALAGAVTLAGAAAVMVNRRGRGARRVEAL